MHSVHIPCENTKRFAFDSFLLVLGELRCHAVYCQPSVTASSLCLSTFSASLHLGLQRLIYNNILRYIFMRERTYTDTNTNTINLHKVTQIQASCKTSIQHRDTFRLTY